jgi:enamine deaminase RidA (YjgF/YER057c/UK114 family)
MNRHNVYTGTSWEKQVAYCRAKRVGNAVFVSGTVAVDEAGKVVGNTMYEQARFILQKIERALRECDATLADVVRTRMFITDFAFFDGVARAHQEAFAGIDPVTTCVQVAALVTPELQVEIEAEALVGD